MKVQELLEKFGFEKSTGELIFFMDSDDYLKDNNVLEKINEIYLENNFDILFFDFISIRKRKIKQKNVFVNKRYNPGTHDVKELEETIVEGALWGKIMKRSYLKSEYFYHSNNFEDYYTTYCYLENCSNFYYTDEVFYVADKNNKASLTNNMTVSKMSEAIDIILKIYKMTKLKKSVSLLALHYYIFGFKILSNIKIEDKSNIKQKLESLKSIFPQHIVREIRQKFNVKYLVYYAYLETRRKK